jgi:hypothetical protein
MYESNLGGIRAIRTGYPTRSGGQTQTGGIVLYCQKETRTMKGTKARGTLDRDAISDLWRNTLSQIPAVFGRLVYLAALRDPNSGRYEHHGLALVFGENEADRALRRSHIQTFSEWLCFNLEQQKADLGLYLSALQDERRRVIETWLRLEPFRTLVPTSATKTETELYYSDFRILLSLLKNEYGVDGPDRDA